MGENDPFSRAGVLQAECDSAKMARRNIDEGLVFVLSTKTKAGTKSQAHNLKMFLKRRERCSVGYLSDLAHTLFSRRSMLGWRVAVKGTALESLIEGLDIEPQRALHDPQIGFVFTGQGA